jgi:hypothetical protein
MNRLQIFARPSPKDAAAAALALTVQAVAIFAMPTSIINTSAA